MCQSSRNSGSSDLVCGSLFTNALVEKLTQVGVTKTPLIGPDDDLTEDQNESWQDLEKTLYEYLIVNVDRRGYEHGLKFAQDDAGGNFEELGDALQDWTKNKTFRPRGPLTQDLLVTEEQRLEYIKLMDEEKAKVTKMHEETGSEDPEASSSALDERRTNAHERDLFSRVSNIGTDYLNGYQGFDDTGDDGALHNVWRWIQLGRITDMDRIESVHRALDYRMSHMSTVDVYLQMMHVPPPKGQCCCEYNIKRVEKQVREDKHYTIRRLILDCEILFPRPIGCQGRPFYKGMDYLIAAFHHASLSHTAIVEKLTALTAAVDQKLDQESEIAKCDPEVASKRRKLFRSFGVASVNMCPIM